MNYETLKTFCGAPGRFAFDHPFNLRGYTYATDAALLVRIPGEFAEPSNDSVPPVRDEWWQADRSQPIELVTLPKEKTNTCSYCDGKGRVTTCLECDGSGEVECHCCGQDTDCQECDGSGKVDGEGDPCDECGGAGQVPEHEYTLPFGQSGKAFRVAYLQKLCDAGLRYAVPNGEMLLAWGDGCEAVLMNCNPRFFAAEKLVPWPGPTQREAI